MTTAIKHRCVLPGCQEHGTYLLRQEGQRIPLHVCEPHYLAIAEAWDHEHIRYDATKLTPSVPPVRREDPLRETLEEYGETARHPQAGRYGYW